MSEERNGPRWGRWLAVGLVVAVGWGMIRGGDHSGPAASSGASPSTSSTSAASPGTGSANPSAPSASSAPSAPSGRYDPADHAAPVREYAAQAGISPQLLMAILYNESYKPHDPDFERAWQRSKPDASFGIANMHRAAFDDTKQGRDFASRRWEELPDDRNLAIQAAAWHLRDLADQLPAKPATAFTRDELLALGYNTGAGNMLAFARGAKPGSQAQSYLDRLHDNWQKSGAAVK
ncbi:transglycosylase SLT domain-containing protein [Kitasatospora aureofaciens]|uniref:transglycosylase SLT domain-containing protein n=1 Tax=Kitasatospora aureofaciens TaxID=1894 RepID=UPI001C48D24B|nr:transglycosylase SLT domain-containing protein [Kitasatospora aureofaciens]MBV6702478.1 lytic transglycosylase domain-containing protein [Kitasatospora aureofaciens]